MSDFYDFTSSYPEENIKSNLTQIQDKEVGGDGRTWRMIMRKMLTKSLTKKN